jgi:hypothetical protein
LVKMAKALLSSEESSVPPATSAAEFWRKFRRVGIFKAFIFSC